MPGRPDTSTLWDVLGQTSNANRATVEKLIADASALLSRVIETFPTYTLHDRQHSDNVVRLMEQILGDEISRLTPLEAAVLLISAYLHDIGMVFTSKELAHTSSDPDFMSFLNDRPELYERHLADPTSQRDILEEYGRSRHAERVIRYLAGLPDEQVKWNGFSLRGPLREICRSHGQDPATLREDRFDPVHLGERCDLRLCAVLLRLADILDFDQSRSPATVYRHLHLRTDDSRRVSDVEWKKHLSSAGFTFPCVRTPNYTLIFAAHPSDPNVEHAMRAFLDVVEKELHSSHTLLPFCSDFRDLCLPGFIDRTNIRSEGYKYGDYRFELARDEVLELFTGENLYESPLVFLRELLQNSIDATRLRNLLAGEETHEGLPRIEFTCWQDTDGYIWVRLDDDGVGMTEAELRDYYLKVGRSYYRSAKFRTSLLRIGEKGANFRSISQFGVGVLSCFIVGDHLELSTLADSTRPGAEPVRLSIGRGDDFFVLQAGDMTPEPMPSRSGKSDGYRRSPGTSVAVRINPRTIATTVNELLAKFETYVFSPAGPIVANGEDLALRHSAASTTPWLQAPLTVRGTSTRTNQTADEYDEYVAQDLLPYLGPISCVAVPLNLTQTDVHDHIRGQAVAVFPIMPRSSRGSRASDLFRGWPADLLGRVPGAVREILSKSVTSYELRGLDAASGGPDDPDSRILHLNIVRRIRLTQLNRAIGYLHETEQAGDELWVARNIPDAGTDWFRMFETGQIQPSRYLRLALERIRKSGGNLVPFKYIVVGPEADELALQFDEWHTRSRWGYNGVSLGKHFFRPDDGGGRNSSPFALFLALALTDTLRPTVNTARSRVTDTTFSIDSALHLSIRRALQEYGGQLPRRVLDNALSANFSRPRVNLDAILNDTLFTDSGCRLVRRALLSTTPSECV